jgi:ecotin
MEPLQNMNKKLRRWLITGFLASALPGFAADHPELKAFPPAEAGMERFVIVLPHKQRGEEDRFKVEIIAGKEMLSDGVNIMRLGSTIEPRDLPGWGYTYYKVTGPGLAMSTLMAPPEGVPMTKRFVQAPSLLIRYNSRLPIVVFAPEGFQIRYRVWQAPESSEQADRG